MSDIYKKDLHYPAKSAKAITPSDVTPIEGLPPRALYIGSGGDLVVVLASDTTPVTFSNLPSGYLLPVIVRYVYSTGSTAADIVGLY